MAEWLKEFTQLLAHCRIIGQKIATKIHEKNCNKYKNLKKFLSSMYIIYIYGSSLVQKVVLLTDSQNTLRGPWAGHILKKNLKLQIP